MNKYNLLAQNLNNYKKLRNITTSKLATELDIPTATLKHILNEGNTTLHTAIRISRNLGIGLDMLVGDCSFADKLFILDHIQRAGGWLSELPPEKSNKIAALISEIWEVISG